jgi:hypothetical protein
VVGLVLAKNSSAGWMHGVHTNNSFQCPYP